MHQSCDLTYGLPGDCRPAPPWLPQRVLGGTRWGWGARAATYLPGGCQACTPPPPRWPRSPAPDGHDFLSRAGLPARSVPAPLSVRGLYSGFVYTALPGLSSLERGTCSRGFPPPRFLGSPAQHKGGCGPLGLWVAMFAEMAASPSFLSASNWAPLPEAVANLVWRSTAPLTPLPTTPLIEASGPCWDPQCGNWQQHAGGRQP